MPANVYECMFLLDTSKVAGDVANADKQLRTIFERNNAEVLVSRPWDERRLTYQIRNQKKGLYYLTYFSAEGKSLTGIESDCKLTEMIMRQLILKIDPKLVETMLSIAKGEHAVALHNIHEEGADEGGAAPAATEEEGPRRPRAPRDKE
ncbi:MAG: 30S ribosomal protein S6 [Gemmataceae bacterium]|nr:30S ribosomal protein S6 [Gemmataceae bacterium]